MIVIDTNVLIYACNQADPRRQNRGRLEKEDVDAPAHSDHS